MDGVADHLLRSARWLDTPQGIEELVDACHPVAVNGQGRTERTVPTAAHLDRRAFHRARTDRAPPARKASGRNRDDPCHYRTTANDRLRLVDAAPRSGDRRFGAGGRTSTDRALRAPRELCTAGCGPLARPPDLAIGIASQTVGTCRLTRHHRAAHPRGRGGRSSV